MAGCVSSPCTGVCPLWDRGRPGRGWSGGRWRLAPAGRGSQGFPCDRGVQQTPAPERGASGRWLQCFSLAQVSSSRKALPSLPACGCARKRPSVGYCASVSLTVRGGSSACCVHALASSAVLGLHVEARCRREHPRLFLEGLSPGGRVSGTPLAACQLEALFPVPSSHPATHRTCAV